VPSSSNPAAAPMSPGPTSPPRDIERRLVKPTNGFIMFMTFPLLDEIGSWGGRANSVIHAVRSARVLFRSSSTVDRDREPVSFEAIKKTGDWVVGDCEGESRSP
jgi:hypothetical protein